ncbi:AMP-binding protein [Micromonospora sp. LOL_013]|uniref:AMP-binding protein n=1 Tax=Micromonospora sp. LOL_013 TaxID=3345414 RepID=UPI003A843220
MTTTAPTPMTVDIPDLSLPAFVLQRAEQYGDRTALVDVAGGDGYTYRQLASMVRRLAAGLHARGLRRGDVLAMLAPNVPEYPIVVLAASLAGGTVVVLNPIDTPDDLAGHLTDAGAKLLVTVPSEVPKAAALAARTKIEEIVVMGEADGATPLSELLSDEPAPEVAIDPAQDVAALLHSSGSTGRPKGVMLTHRNIVATVLQTRTVTPLGADEKVLAMPPFHHAFGLIMVMSASLLQGATIVTMPRFDPEGYVKAIHDHRITRLYIVPTLAVLLARSPLPDRYDLSSVRSIVSGGAALDPEIARLCRERLGCHIAQGYGLTEAMTSFMQLEEPLVPASVGRTAPNVECRIVDVNTGAQLGAHQRGEILIRGPHVMKGYLNAAEVTSKVLRPDGFLHTGDLGYLDDDGELFLVDRIKELIKYKGQQVSPVELEAVLMTHPKVADAAVIGVPDEEASEIPKAFVVAKEPTTEQELMAFVAERVAPYKKIRQIEFIEQIPRTPVGKIERRRLKERTFSS